MIILLLIKKKTENRHLWWFATFEELSPEPLTMEPLGWSATHTMFGFYLFFTYIILIIVVVVFG
jgi:hypothetical protein